MATKTKEKTRTNPNDDSIKKVILDTLGTPKDLLKVDVKRLHWPEYYRINIYRKVGTDHQVSITDSFYTIITQPTKDTLSLAYCNPPIQKRY